MQLVELSTGEVIDISRKRVKLRTPEAGARRRKYKMNKHKKQRIRASTVISDSPQSDTQQGFAHQYAGTSQILGSGSTSIILASSMNG